MSFDFNDDIELEEAGNGVKRKILSHSKNVMLVEVYFEKDAVGPPHKHIHEQINYVQKGSFEITMDGVTKVLKEKDSMFIPPNSLHGCVALEEGILLNIFTPRREDFLK
ncbi:MAG: cupin domain-containing protein [Spirochaetales bacterium]|nr:cupin domain-containing protein [Spirochaetales bacterium]